MFILLIIHWDASCASFTESIAACSGAGVSCLVVEGHIHPTHRDKQALTRWEISVISARTLCPIGAVYASNRGQDVERHLYI